MICHCFHCCSQRDEERWGGVFTVEALYSRETSRYILCEECGNKRCPHATHHGYACTGSNEPGQEGSRYQYWEPSCV